MAKKTGEKSKKQAGKKKSKDSKKAKKENKHQITKEPPKKQLLQLVKEQDDLHKQSLANIIEEAQAEQSSAGHQNSERVLSEIKEDTNEEKEHSLLEDLLPHYQPQHKPEQEEQHQYQAQTLANPEPSNYNQAASPQSNYQQPGEQDNLADPNATRSIPKEDFYKHSTPESSYQKEKEEHDPFKKIKEGYVK